MKIDVKSIIEKSKEVANLLKGFSNKEEAVEYLINETKLSKKECSDAYDILLKMADLAQDKTAQVLDSLYGSGVTATIGKAINEYYGI